MPLTGLNANWEAWTTDFRRELADAWANLVKDDSKWRAFTEIIPSTSDRNDYGFLKDPPQVTEWKGSRKESSLAFDNHVVINKDWQVSVPVPRNAVEDDKYDIIARRVRALMPAFDRHMAKSVIEAYKNGAAAGSLGPDDVPFFGTHTLDNGDTVDNMTGAVTWVLIDTTRSKTETGGVFLQMRKEPVLDEFGPGSEWAKQNKAYKFMGDGRYQVGYGMWQCCYASNAALNKAGVDAAFEAMQAFKDINGDPLGMAPDVESCMLLIPTSLWADARALTTYDTTTGYAVPYKGLRVYSSGYMN